MNKVEININEMVKTASESYIDEIQTSLISTVPGPRGDDGLSIKGDKGNDGAATAIEVFMTGEVLKIKTTFTYENPEIDEV